MAGVQLPITSWGLAAQTQSFPPSLIQPLALSTADYALEIIQPREGLDTTNRFYKQYPAIEYNVRLGVIGGVYDSYVYSLPTSPSGMTIDANTGEITWANPVEAGSPHNITARVTDSNGFQEVRGH